MGNRRHASSHILAAAARGNGKTVLKKIISLEKESMWRTV